MKGREYHASYRISTSCSIASCKRFRSRSNSSSVAAAATRCGRPKMTRTVENGRGRMKRSQLRLSKSSNIPFDRHDFRARLLREKDDPLSEFIGRTARSVRRDDDVPAVRDDFCELSNGTGAFAGTGAPNDFEIEALHEIGEQRAIAAGADERRALPLRQVAFDDKRQEEQAIVPECPM